MVERSKKTSENLLELVRREVHTQLSKIDSASIEEIANQVAVVLKKSAEAGRNATAGRDAGGQDSDGRGHPGGQDRHRRGHQGGEVGHRRGDQGGQGRQGPGREDGQPGPRRGGVGRADAARPRSRRATRRTATRTGTRRTRPRRARRRRPRTRTRRCPRRRPPRRRPAEPLAPPPARQRAGAPGTGPHPPGGPDRHRGGERARGRGAGRQAGPDGRAGRAGGRAGAALALREPRGLKLAAALDRFDVLAHGRRALDAGASTGGFTDCLLQRGAARVYAVDVGHGQLDAGLRADDRVVVLERVNVRTLTRGPAGGGRPDVRAVPAGGGRPVLHLAALGAARAVRPGDGGGSRPRPAGQAPVRGGPGRGVQGQGRRARPRPVAGRARGGHVRADRRRNRHSGSDGLPADRCRRQRRVPGARTQGRVAGRDDPSDGADSSHRVGAVGRELFAGALAEAEQLVAVGGSHSG